MKDAGKLRLFEGYGVELEYMIVDQQSLSVLPVADRVLQAQAESWLMSSRPERSAGRMSWCCT